VEYPVFRAPNLQAGATIRLEGFKCCPVHEQLPYRRGVGFVERERKKPGGSSKGMQAVKIAFSKRYKMKAIIPDFIDGYNHSMNGVNLMDQSRNAFQSLRKCFRTWKPRWHFFLDATSSNCFRLSAYSPHDDDPKFESYRKDRRATTRSLRSCVLISYSWELKQDARSLLLLFESL
jgi:hypothetical protein